MMADLIRTSMFCDVNDVFAEDELQLLANEHSCYDVFYKDDVSSHSYNFLEYVARTSDLVDEIASDQAVLPETTSQTVSDVTAKQTTDTDGNTSPQCCHGSVISEDICGDFLSRIVQASRVDLSTFNSVCSGEIFGNDYVQSIELKKEASAFVNQQACRETGPKRSSYTHKRPPYSYAACAVTAIYLSDKDCLSVNEILDHLCSMFDEVKTGCRRVYRKRFYKVLRTHSLFRQMENDSFQVVPGHVKSKTFHRQLCTDQERAKYDNLIHYHFGVPSMLHDLGIEPRDVHTKTVRQRKKTSVYRRSANVQNLLKFRKSSVSVEGHSHTENSESFNHSSDLKMPQRPCFHDDPDNEDDELLTQHSRRNISPMSSNSSHDSTTVCCDESRNSVQDNYYMDFEQGLRSTDIPHNQSVVVPVPRYAVPTPSACIPLRCQEYNIPFVGTFQLVDMYYNGQIIHQLFA